MNRQPIYNERRFYRYPMFRVAAILDDAEDTRTALDALERAGVDIAKVNLLTGHEGARVLDRTGRKHGWGARLLRLFQRGAYEGDALEAHERALEEGRNVIFVPVRATRRASGSSRSCVPRVVTTSCTSIHGTSPCRRRAQASGVVSQCRRARWGPGGDDGPVNLRRRHGRPANYADPGPGPHRHPGRGRSSRWPPAATPAQYRLRQHDPACVRADLPQQRAGGTPDPASIRRNSSRGERSSPARWSGSRSTAAVPGRARSARRGGRARRAAR